MQTLFTVLPKNFIEENAHSEKNKKINKSRKLTIYFSNIQIYVHALAKDLFDSVRLSRICRPDRDNLLLRK